MLVGERLENEPNFYQEIDFLKHLAGINGVPVVHKHFQYEQKRVLVMDKYLENLEQFRKRKEDEKLSPRVVIKLAFRLVSILEHIHRKGVVHQDIKLDNVVFGAKVGNKLDIVLIDYGIAAFTKPKPPRDLVDGALHCTTDFSSSVYASPGLVQGLKGDPVDDLQMLSFMLLWASKYDPFGEDSLESLRKKKEFIAKPSIFTQGDYKFLRPVISKIMEQKRSKRPDYKAISKKCANKDNYFNPDTAVHLGNAYEFF